MLSTDETEKKNQTKHLTTSIDKGTTNYNVDSSPEGMMTTNMAAWFKTSSPLESDISSPDDVSMSGQILDYPEILTQDQSYSIAALPDEDMLSHRRRQQPINKTKNFHGIDPPISNINENQKNNHNDTISTPIITPNKTDIITKNHGKSRPITSNLLESDSRKKSSSPPLDIASYNINNNNNCHNRNDDSNIITDKKDQSEMRQSLANQNSRNLYNTDIRILLTTNNKNNYTNSDNNYSERVLYAPSPQVFSSSTSSLISPRDENNTTTTSNNNEKHYNNLKTLKQFHGTNEKQIRPDNNRDLDMSSSFRYKKNQAFSNSTRNPVLTKNQNRLYDQINNNSVSAKITDPLIPQVEIIGAPKTTPDSLFDYNNSNDNYLMENVRGFSNRSKSLGRKPLFETTNNSNLLSESNENFYHSSNYKSVNSLLETDIDTGLCVERDAAGNIMNQENYLDKTRSLFNLNSSLENEENEAAWLKAYSVQQLNDDGNNSKPIKDRGTSASGLIARLRSKAKSEHELRVANSLSRLIIPDWLDNANLPEPFVFSNELLKRRDLIRDSEKPKPLERMSIMDENVKANLPSYGDRFEFTSGELRKSLNLDELREKKHGQSRVETVMEPTQIDSVPRPQPIQFIRPSQLYRMKHAKNPKLEPIQSKLNHSMRTNIHHANSQMNSRHRTTIAPMDTHVMSIESNLPLGPNDFKMVHEENAFRIEAKPFNNPSKPGVKPRTNVPKNPINYIYPEAITSRDELRKSQYNINEAMQVAQDEAMIDVNDDHGLKQASKQRPRVSLVDNTNRQQYVDNNKPINNPMNGLSASSYNNPQELREKPEGRATAPTPEEINYADGATERSIKSHQDSQQHNDVSSQAKTNTTGSSDCSFSNNNSPSTMPSDGLNKINCLTELTKLIDASTSRNESLLKDHLDRASWKRNFFLNQPGERNRSSLRHVTQAMHKVDFSEDSHKHDILNLLANSQSNEPINLSEFALSQLSGCVERDKYDGKIYLSCSYKSCNTCHVRTKERVDWQTCTNCYTIYCSQSCLRKDFESGMHTDLCNFSRAKRLCNLIQKNLNYNQILLLNNIAQRGHDKLGQGAIFLFFSSSKMSETFIRLSNIGGSSTEKKAEFISPVYLTLNEIGQLDSSLMRPCQEFSTSKTFLVVVIICAFELTPMVDQTVLPVHLIKQHFILNHKLLEPNINPDHGFSEDPKIIETGTYEDRKVFVQRTLKRLNRYQISLKRDFPKIYKLLLEFIHTGRQFSPMEFVITDPATTKEFICFIQPMEDVIFNELTYPTPEVNNYSSTKITTTNNNNNHHYDHREESVNHEKTGIFVTETEL